MFTTKKSINTECLNRVFSESDKRSLALAIFLAKINQLGNKLENIIVLDDPVVSFDENRMKVSADIISELSNTHCQVILLTHFRSFVGKLYESKIEAKYYSMVKTADTTTYKDFNPKTIIQSEWERAFDKIWSYISRLHTDDIAPDCRIYLEKYLEFRY